MSARLSTAADEPADLKAAYRAVRTRVGAVAILFTIAGLGWWWSAGQVMGMDAGPWSPLGSPGWFLGAWTVMMAAMMLPSVSPTIALYSRMTRTSAPLQPIAFTAGYLLVWTATGGLALLLADAAMLLLPGAAGAWSRPLTVATLLLAAAYEFTPWKSACLGKCRNPLSFLLGTWRDGRRGALVMGVKLGAWCVGCCWALMAALFALGVMNIVWMASVAALIGLEKLLPWRRTATWVTTAVLIALALVALLAPESMHEPSNAPQMPMSAA